MPEKLIVQKENAGKRLDVVLASHPLIASRSVASKVIKNGEVRINHSEEKAVPRRMMREGDRVTFSPPVPESIDVEPVAYPLDILHEDKDIFVINKPAGMVVHPAVGHTNDTLVNYLLYHGQLAPSTGDPSRPGIVHRIDKDTSGLLVVSRNEHAHESLSRQFAEHKVMKIYQAIVWGEVVQGKGVVNQPLGRHPVDRKKRAIIKSGKEAITHYSVLKRFSRLSFLQCRLETGRTHQIRVHLNYLGHPLLGDPVYGGYRNYSKKFPVEFVQLLKNCERQSLHAYHLGFFHPTTEEWTEFTAPLPEDLQQILQALEEYAL